MPKYLVCRMDAIKPGHSLSSSEFPMVVEGIFNASEDIVRAAFDTFRCGYIGMHSYLVVPLNDAHVVTFRPKKDYEVLMDIYR